MNLFLLLASKHPHVPSKFDWETHVMQCKETVEQAVAALARAELVMQNAKIHQQDPLHQQREDK
jgi:hypothetical protein